MAEPALFSGQNRILVDWDGTCVPSAWPERPEEWLPGTVDALRDFGAAGLEVYIYTTRLAPKQIDEDTDVTASAFILELNYIRDMLDNQGLTWVRIWTKPWKPGGLFYVDDKGVAFTGNWEAVVQEVLK